MWPPASCPSMIRASTPPLTSCRAIPTVGAKQRSLLLVSLMRLIASRGGRPPARITKGNSIFRTCSRCLAKLGAMVIRFMPKGLSVLSRVFLISSLSIAGGMFPPAKTPKAPALEMAETRVDSEIQVMAPPKTGYSTPRNSLPRLHNLSISSRGIRTSCSPSRTAAHQPPRAVATHPTAVRVVTICSFLGEVSMAGL